MLMPELRKVYAVGLVSMGVGALSVELALASEVHHTMTVAAHCLRGFSVASLCSGVAMISTYERVPHLLLAFTFVACRIVLAVIVILVLARRAASPGEVRLLCLRVLVAFLLAAAAVRLCVQGWYDGLSGLQELVVIFLYVGWLSLMLCEVGDAQFSLQHARSGCPIKLSRRPNAQSLGLGGVLE